MKKLSTITSVPRYMSLMGNFAEDTPNHLLKGVYGISDKENLRQAKMDVTNDKWKKQSDNLKKLKDVTASLEQLNVKYMLAKDGFKVDFAVTGGKKNADSNKT